MSTPQRRWLSLSVIALTVITAFFVALPPGTRIRPEWVYAANFALGMGLLLTAFLEIARAIRAWFTRAATLRWIGTGILAGAGLLVAGEAALLSPRGMAMNWTVLAGIVTAVIGSVAQQRAADQSGPR